MGLLFYFSLFNALPYTHTRKKKTIKDEEKTFRNSKSEISYINSSIMPYLNDIPSLIKYM